MKNWNFLKLSFCALIAMAATAFTACVDDNEDTEAPYLEVTPAILNFDADGVAVDGRDWFEVRTNRPWAASMDTETGAWLTLAPESGNGTTKVAVSVPAGNRSGKVTFTIANAMGPLKSQTVVVNVGEVKPEEVIFKETMGTGDVSTNPFVDQYTSWDTTGTGAGEVTYSGQTVSVRKSGIANNGSGPNVLFFGKLPAWFSVNKIKLTPEQTDLKLTFLAQSSFKPEGSSEYDNAFDKSTFKVALSGDGQKWTEIDYTTDTGDAEYPYWVSAAANFSLKQASEFLYIRFTAEKASAYRLDDIMLVTGNGGQEIDLANGGVDPEPGPGPDVDALFYENFGKGEKVTVDGKENWGYIDQYTDYSKSGAAYVEGTTTYAGSSASVRTNSYNSAPVPPFSGAGHVWFAAGGGTLTVSKLVLQSTQTKLQLSVGVLGGDASGKVTYDPASANLKFELSADGNTWTAIDNSKIVCEAQGEGAENVWSIAKVDFTLKKAVSNLYIRFSGKALRLDDATLSESETGGVEIDLEGGSEPGPDPSDDVYYYNPVGTSAVSANTPIADYSWGATGTGVANVTYSKEGNVDIRKSGKSSAGAYEGASGPNVVFFGTQNPVFMINNIAVPASQTDMQLTFGASRSSRNDSGQYDNAFKTDVFTVSLSADGTNWKQITYKVNDGDQRDPYWVFATADFTLTKGVSALYIRFAASEFSVIRLDDIKLAPSTTGGQSVDLEGGSTTEPAVTTADYASLAATSVVLGGSSANLTATEVGVQYIEFATGTVSQLDWSKAVKAKAASVAATWTVAVEGLTAETQYAYRAYATTASGDVYGDPKTFVTEAAGGSTVKTITIPEMIAKMTSTATVLDPDNDYEFEAVVMNDVAGGNFTFNNLIVATENATTAKNGVTLYGNAVAPSTLGVTKGDKVKITLYKGLAKLQNYNGMYEITGDATATWCKVEKVGTATVNPVTITVDKLAEYQGMAVTIADATTSAAGVWATAAAAGNHTLTAGGTSFAVYVKKGAAAFVDKKFAAMTASISGLAAVNRNAAQLVPRNWDDVKAFEDNGSATAPEITTLTPDALVWEPTATDGKTIIIAGTNLDGAQFTLSTPAHFAAQMWGGEIAVAPLAANDTDKDIVETLTVSVAGGNSKTVTLTHKTANTSVGGGEETETFANYEESLASEASVYTNSGSFAGVISGNPTWNYTGCGNPNQAATDKSALETAGLTVSSGAVYVAMGKKGTLSVTIKGGLSGLKFNALTSSKAIGKVTVSLNGTELKSVTVAKNSKKAVEVTGIESNGQDVEIKFEETSGNNRFTIGDVVLTK